MEFTGNWKTASREKIDLPNLLPEYARSTDHELVTRFHSGFCVGKNIEILSLIDYYFTSVSDSRTWIVRFIRFKYFCVNTRYTTHLRGDRSHFYRFPRALLVDRISFARYSTTRFSKILTVSRNVFLYIK